MHVKAAVAIVVQNVGPFANAVSTYQLLCLHIPDKQLVIIQVELVEVDAAVGTFAHFAEGDLAQAADLAQHIGNLTRGGTVHRKVFQLKQQALGFQAADLAR